MAGTLCVWYVRYAVNAAGTGQSSYALHACLCDCLFLLVDIGLYRNGVGIVGFLVLALF